MTMSNNQFLYEYELIIDNGAERRIWRSDKPGAPGLDISFQGAVTTDGEPNHCEIQMFNLSEDSRGFISKKNIGVELKAGYRDAIGTIFKGTLDSINHKNDHTDWISILNVKDGATALKYLHISESFKKDTPVYRVIERIIDRLTATPDIEAELEVINEITQEKIDILPVLDAPPPKKKKTSRIQRQLTKQERIKRKKEQLAASRARSRELKLKKDIILRGAAGEKLNVFAQAYKLKWFVTDQKLFVMPIEAVLTDEEIELNPGSGLIGSPEPIETGYKVFANLNHLFKPARVIRLNSRYVKGLYEIVKHEFRGDTSSNEWDSELELIPYYPIGAAGLVGLSSGALAAIS